jgi:phosphoserine phosphatase
MESALTIVPPVCRAISSASRDLPLAVGPAIRIAFSIIPPRTVLPMALVATLISNPADRAPVRRWQIRPRGRRRKRGRLAGARIACDLPVAAEWRGQCEALLRDAIGGAGRLRGPAADDRRRRILIADMDSTMIDQECIDELADMVGVRDRVPPSPRAP